MKRMLLVVAAFAALALAGAGCGSGGGGGNDDNPFRGTWRIVSYGVDVTFGDDDYSITIPDLGRFTGSYAYQGEYPDFVASLTVRGQADATLVNVHFIGEDQFVAVDVSDAGNSSVFDRI